MNHQIDVIEIPDLPTVYHRGPPLNLGPLPSVIYFSLSGVESLSLDPYNQPAVFLCEAGIRVFSVTLPGHEGSFPHSHAIKTWRDKLAAGEPFIEAFTETCKDGLDFLIEKRYVDPGKIGVSGLSRGAFIATHLAAKDERITRILGFAPLTRLDVMKDFNEFGKTDFVDSLSLKALIPRLLDKTVRFYIGNCDTMVGTGNCFAFIESLAANAYEHTRRFPPVELIIYPSIGHKGHGTPKHIFESGAAWLAE